MTTENIYSPIKDLSIRDHIKDSNIWNHAYTEEEHRKFRDGTIKKWFKYTIKFDGLIPIMVTKIEIL
uniref:Uncharacterized protein n=1 Tax=viral metagenome TaxID=1070528 RepID=A0A6M3K1F7_9ZZZZ